jgi:hypothetical protein
LVADIVEARRYVRPDTGALAHPIEPGRTDRSCPAAAGSGTNCR